jgi:hypothetical protein
MKRFGMEYDGESRSDPVCLSMKMDNLSVTGMMHTPLPLITRNFTLETSAPVTGKYLMVKNRSQQRYHG